MEALRVDDPTRIGPFQLLGRLGAGGMGQVYLAHGPDGGHAAVKVVHAGYGEDERFRTRFAHEVQTALRVHGSWAAVLLDADPNAPRPWLACEYVPGPSLDRAVAEHGPLSEPALAALASRLSRALAELHAFGVVHRDLKPSNVLLGVDGPKLIDFGIARAVGNTRITHAGGVVGTPAFMSPEQADGRQEDYPSDVFSLASVLVFASNGEGPFGRTANAVAMLLRVATEQPKLDTLPDWLRAELEPCLRRDPSERPTAAELAARLADHPGSLDALLANARPAEAPPIPLPPGPTVETTAVRRRRWLPWAVGASVVVLATAISAAYLWRSSEPAARPVTTAAGPVTVIPPAVLASPRPIPMPWPDTHAVYIAPPDGPILICSGNTLRILDSDSFALRNEIDFPAEVRLLVVPPTPNQVYVRTGDAEITPVNLTTKQLGQRIPVPGPIDDMVLSWDGKRLVTTSSTGALNELNLDTRAVRAVPLGVPRPTFGYYLGSDDHRAYVTTAAPNPALVAVDLGTMTATPVNFPVDPGDVRLPRARTPVPSPDGRTWYALADHAVLVFDAATNTLRQRIPQSGTLGSALTVSRNGRYLFVATEGGELLVLDAATGVRVSAGRTTKQATGMTTSKDGGKLYVGERDLLEIFDTSAFR